MKPVVLSCSAFMVFNAAMIKYIGHLLDIRSLINPLGQVCVNGWVGVWDVWVRPRRVITCFFKGGKCMCMCVWVDFLGLKQRVLLNPAPSVRLSVLPSVCPSVT